ncbi:MAG TPA: nuclear transport factor 2 family protein [Methylocella sp.]|nr:nuclear transport factor 2 family protein [Methylocella sp.]
MVDKASLLAANAAFYTAFRIRDLAGMTSLWADDDTVSCIHPGWPAIIGRKAVVGSWRNILGSEHSPAISCHDPYAIISGDEGRVLCIEKIGSMALAASNHFRQIEGHWKLVHHQSSPIALPDEPGENGGQPSLVH